MHRKYGVGPGSLLAVAVNVTEPPAAGFVLLDARETVQQLVAIVGVTKATGLVGMVPPAWQMVRCTAPLPRRSSTWRTYLHVAAATEPLAMHAVLPLSCRFTWTGEPLETSYMQRKYGDGPGSLFAVAVSVTVPPGAGLVALAASETVQ